MGVGQIISGTFGTVKQRFGPLLGLWATYFVITIGAFIVLGIAIGATGMAGLAAMGEGGNAMALGGAMIVIVILFYIGYLLVALAQYASLIAMASPTAQPSFADAFGAGWRAAPAMLLLMVVLIIGYIVFAIGFSLLAAVFAAMGEAASLLAVLVVLPVLVWIGCRLCPLFAVVAVDRVRNPFTAIGRAWQLTRGHALTIFLASLVFFVILAAIFAVALLPSIGVLTSLADPATLTGANAVGAAFGSMALFGLGLLVASILVNLLYCAFIAVVHGALSDATGSGAAETFA